MVLKNVVVNWAFIAEPDEEGLYRIQFEISKKSEDYALLIAEMQKCMATAGKSKSDITWWAGFRDHESNPDIALFNAKTRDEYKDKRTGETRKRALPVFDVFAKQYGQDQVPKVANGAICNVEVSPYFASFHNKFGIMLGLRSVQLMQFEIYSQNPYSDESKNRSSQAESEITISQKNAQSFVDSDSDNIPF